MTEPTAALKSNDNYLSKLSRNYQVFRFMGGNLISFFGDQIYLIALPLIILKLTGSPLNMGIVAALERLPIWLQPVTGVLSDRLNRKMLLMMCDAGRCLIIGCIGILFIINHLGIWVIYIGALIIGVLSQIYNTSQFASVPRLVRKNDLQAINSINTSLSKTAMLLGPGLGGLIVSIYNPGYALLINSFSFFVSFLTVSSIPLITSQLSPLKKKPFIKEIDEGFKFVIKIKPILLTNIAILVSMSGTTLFLTMMIFHLKDTIHLSTTQIGWLLSLGGIGSILGALSTNFLIKMFSHRKLLFASALFGGISIVLFSYAHSFFWLVIWNLIGDLMASMMNPCILTIRQTLTPDHLLGRVQATSRFISWIFLPLSSLSAGILALYMGTSHTILVGGIVATIASIFYLHPSLKSKTVDRC